MPLCLRGKRADASATALQKESLELNLESFRRTAYEQHVLEADRLEDEEDETETAAEVAIAEDEEPI